MQIHKELHFTTHSMRWSVYRIGFLLSGIIICLGFLIPAPFLQNEKIDKLFSQQLDELATKISDIEKACDQKSRQRTLKKKFLDTRLSYKKAAVLIDYFHPFETRLLNGAALPRTEDDVPEKILAPHGFQVLEEILFGEWTDSSYTIAKAEVIGIKNIITQFKQEPNRAFKFKNELVFDALRSSLIRMTALGISGFDSPIAENSISEAAATLESIQTLLNIYDTNNSSNQSKETTNKLLSDAIDYLNSNRNFNRFDRAFFITNYINPVFSTIVKTGKENGFLLPKERRPLNQQTESIFSDSLFDISFYSPTERYRSTPERIQLGKLLFFDPILSATRDRSCGTCHKTEIAFTDGLKTALAVDQKTYLLRNTPTLWNSVFQTKQFFDSRTAMLEHQLTDVVHNQEEMKGSLTRSVKELGANPNYAALFQKAYANETPVLTEYNISNAISSYVRSLIAVNSRFDQYMRGDNTKMNKEELKGFNLFMGKAKCATCHFIPLFNGLVPPEFTETESEVLGVPKTKETMSPVLDSDEGRFKFTKSIVHKYAFKTPTLRNIELTAPYMHNGVYNTLEEVMDFYNKGGGNGLKIAPENQTLPEEKLNLSKKEIRAVIAFMKTLTDSAVVKYR